jgi:hypothetical protein
MRVFGNTDLEVRQKTFETLLRELCERKDTCNSQPFIQFLALDKFFPDLVFNMPKMIMTKQLAKKEFVTACEYIEEFNIFVLGVLAAKGGSSRLEIYAFQGKGAASHSFA